MAIGLGGLSVDYIKEESDSRSGYRVLGLITLGGFLWGFLFFVGFVWFFVGGGGV